MERGFLGLVDSLVEATCTLVDHFLLHRTWTGAAKGLSGRDFHIVETLPYETDRMQSSPRNSGVPPRETSCGNGQWGRSKERYHN